MNLTARILTSIGSEEPSSFNEVLRSLGDDAPEKGDKAAWREFFQTINALEQSELVTVERRDGRFEAAQLTDLGAERAREIFRER
jgi:hypothetical protein